jgi:hypothetical protein
MNTVITEKNVHEFPSGTIITYDGYQDRDIVVISWDTDQWCTYLICKDEYGKTHHVTVLIDHPGIGFKLKKIAPKKMSPWSNFSVDI